MEWHWIAAIGGTVALFMLAVELLSRRTNHEASGGSSIDDEDDDADGSDSSNADADE